MTEMIVDCVSKTFSVIPRLFIEDPQQHLTWRALQE